MLKQELRNLLIGVYYMKEVLNPLSLSYSISKGYVAKTMFNTFLLTVKGVHKLTELSKKRYTK